MVAVGRARGECLGRVERKLGRDVEVEMEGGGRIQCGSPAWTNPGPEVTTGTGKVRQ